VKRRADGDGGTIRLARHNRFSHPSTTKDGDGISQHFLWEQSNPAAPTPQSCWGRDSNDHSS